MGHFRKLLVALFGAASLVSAGTIAASAHDRGTLIEFDSMTPVMGSAVGTVNERGIKGGGLPWAITSGRGEVDRQGSVEVKVKGLVIPPLGNINPVPFFRATVSCITPHGVVNVSTATFPANSAGDSTINGKVDLPHSCKHPIVFVVAPSGQWFAESNSDEEED